jgi:hypothetical protein
MKGSPWTQLGIEEMMLNRKESLRQMTKIGLEQKIRV